MFNHDMKMNVKPEHIASNLVLMFAAKNIKKGEELLIDYCEGLDIKD